MMTEERKEYMKAYYATHKEERKEYMKAYNQAHKGERKEYNQAHRDEAKEYYEVNKTKLNAYFKFHQKQKYCYGDISQIENYEEAKADNFISWDIHHRLETHTLDGIRRSVDITRKELMKLGVYYNRPASELIFMTHSEHMSLHRKNENKKDKLQC